MPKIAEMSTDSITLSRLKDFSKGMLKTQLFMGTFQEKRYVESLNDYRDVVKIQPSESKFIENALAVKCKLERDLDPDCRVWIGITCSDTVGAPVGYCLWTTLKLEIFGTYWFKVKTVEFLQNEVKVKLEMVRPVEPDDMSRAENFEDLDVTTYLTSVADSLKTNLLYFLQNHVTLTNTKECVVFLVVLCATIITAAVQGLKYFLNYSLMFMREVSHIITASTPFAIACLDFFKNIIGALFKLIYLMVYGRPSRPPQPINYVIGAYEGATQFRPSRSLYYSSTPALPYKSSVQIEEIEN